MYYIYVHIRAIPTYRIYWFYDIIIVLDQSGIILMEIINNGAYSFDCYTAVFIRAKNLQVYSS